VDREREIRNETSREETRCGEANSQEKRCESKQGDEVSSGELQGAEEKRTERHCAVKFLEGSVLNRGTVAIAEKRAEGNRGVAGGIGKSRIAANRIAKTKS